ncbi:synaptotagmin-14 isoform X2 [Corythoichthys intestinalis]|uniref:synaptotagmin-14 isoform X2 n=1 Tax=Corythoichthys intestinalis TaxID=161448 RepID=UPI0025A55F93|nr:synaptotagmin-14 isoform X2 [Corythoichthys intestinalis]
MASDSCLLVWSDQCVIVCPLFLLRPVTPEAVGFLSVVGVFIAALALVFLFINKMLCFSKVGGAPCLEQQQRRRRSRTERSQLARQGVDRTSSADADGGQSSSDSDNQVMKNFEISVSRSQSLRSVPSKVGEQPTRVTELRNQFSHSSEQRDASTELSDSEDVFPPAVVEADDHHNRLDDLQGVPEGPMLQLQQQYSLATVEESPAPSAPELPIMDGDSEDVEALHHQTTAVDATLDPQGHQEPRLQDATPPPETVSSPRQLVSKCCDLLVSLEYRAATEKLLVTVTSARDLPDRRRSGMEAWQVHVVLMPAKKQRHKTSLKRVVSGHPDAPAPLVFGQTFALTHVEASRLAVSALRFRMYALEGRMARRRMMGEKLLPLASVDRAGGSSDLHLVLEPRCNIKSLDSELSLVGDGASSTQSLTHGAVPELLMGLSYSAATGRMSVEIIKGSHFRNVAANRPPDTFARLTLLNSVGHEISRCKTSVRRCQPNPVYKETFVFQVALFQLSDVTLMASVYSRRSLKRKEMIGWAALGQNSSGEEERLHWRDMRDGRGTQVCRWHVLLEA